MFNYNYLFDDGQNNMMNNFNNYSNNSLVSPSVGYDRGNMFSDLYEQYKNYTIDNLKANNEQERLYLELSRMCFAAHQINLYLDLNPNDVSMIKLFNDYRNRYVELLREYESKYGPINTTSDSLEKTPFMWEKSPWPWEDRFNV